jgi:CheY-like chemotaxis protein
MRHCTILYAEDEETDVYLFRMALKKCGLDHTILHVPDGQETIDYLKAEGHYSDRTKYPIPDLLLLDLKMPRASGLEVLEWKSRNGEWKDLPAVMLTSSDHPSDVESAKRLGAADYLIKPHDMASLVEIVRVLNGKWLSQPAQA